MSDQDAVRAEILSVATEDLHGVWEAWWIANRLRPRVPLSDRLRVAEQSLLSLVNEGLASITRGSWDAHVEVPQHEVQPILSEYDTWVASEHGSLVFFEAPTRVA